MPGISGISKYLRMQDRVPLPGVQVSKYSEQSRMNSPRLLLADDHPLVIAGLRSVLEPGHEVAGIVDDGLALVAAARRLNPDIIIADISMPHLNGIEAVRQIRRFNSGVKIIFLTMHSEVTYAAEALSAGGSAYVLKISAGNEILEAIREVLNGRTYVTPSLGVAVVQSYKDWAAYSAPIVLGAS